MMKTLQIDSRSNQRVRFRKALASIASRVLVRPNNDVSYTGWSHLTDDSQTTTPALIEWETIKTMENDWKSSMNKDICDRSTPVLSSNGHIGGAHRGSAPRNVSCPPYKPEYMIN